MATLEIRTPASLAISTGLRDARDGLGISLRELARRTGINPSTISGLEVEGKGAKPTTVSRILGCLQVKGSEYEQLMNFVEHIGVRNYIDQSISSTIDLLAIYEQLSSFIVEWAPFRIPDLLRTRRWLETTDGGEVVPTARLDDELFHRQCRRLPVQPGDRQYVFLIGDQALRMVSAQAGCADQQIDFIREAGRRRDVSIRIIPSSAPAPVHPADAFTIFESGKTPMAAAVRHDRCTAYLTDASLRTSYHDTAAALLQASGQYSTVEAWVASARGRAS